MFMKSAGDKQGGETTPPKQPYAPTNEQMKRSNERRTAKMLDESLKMIRGTADAKPKMY